MLNAALKLNSKLFTSEVETSSTRDAFGKAIVKAARENEDIVTLTADLKESVRLTVFAEEFPKRFVQCGIAEQNMASIGAGLALSGKIPFITSHAIFVPSTNWAQIRQSICLNKANVKIIGSHQGFSNGPDGPMAEPFEDVALMRVLPEMTVINPIDYHQCEKTIIEAVENNGPIYIRLSKAKTAHITTPDTPYKTGQAQVLKEGQDITIATTGPITAEALFAARKLSVDHKIEAEVIAFHTIKPLDTKTLLESAEKTKLVLTVEEHQIAGGLGSTIAEALALELPTQMEYIGMNDSFGESGEYKKLLHKYKMDAQGIVEKVLGIKK